VTTIFASDPENATGNPLLGSDGKPGAGSPDLQNPQFAFTAGSPDLQDAQFMLPDLGAFFGRVNYVGAFSQDTRDTWADGWTVFLNGNLVPWRPSSEGTLNGRVPVADGTCPVGTTRVTGVGQTALPAIFSGAMDRCQLAREYTADGQTLTLTNDNIYLLAAGFPGTRIGNGQLNDLDPTNDASVTVVMEPGTLVLGDRQAALLITRNSRIQAVGSAANPIVMSSTTQFNNWVATGNPDSGLGEWAGLALMGYARENRCPQNTTFAACDIRAEGDVGFYAGNDDADSSGLMDYVVISHAGNDIDGNGNELNVLTLFGVGSGTQLSHIQVHRGLDDGIEFFGGTASVKFLVSTENDDDSIDWGQGWRGNIQFAVVKQSPQSADKLIEADNDEAAPTAIPVSQPTLANLSLLGFLNPGQVGGAGVQLRRGTGARIFNSIITGTRNYCFRVESAASGAMLGTGITIDNSIVSCPASTSFSGSAGVTTQQVQDLFNGSPRNRVVNPNLQGNMQPNPVNGGSNSLQPTNYIGAFAQDFPDNWTTGWTIGVNGSPSNVTVWKPAPAGVGTLNGRVPVADGTCPAGTTLIAGQTGLPAAFAGAMDRCQLDRRYSTTGQVLTLTNDNIYVVAAGFPGTYIGDGERMLSAADTAANVTLSIQPGTLILAGPQAALIITRGSRIQALGEQTAPVVMSSVKQFNDWVAGSDGDSGRGEWAGLALLGFARENRCPASGSCNIRAEGDIGFYGGTNDADSSGVMRFVAVSHAGNDIDGNGNELNGISLFATGSSTTMSFLQSHKGLDDGIEFFGGTSFVDHFVVTGAADDSLDWGQGWRGGAQFGLIKQMSDMGERGIEADNDSSNPLAEPFSMPLLANLTLMGSPMTSPSQTTQGVLLRVGTGVLLTNSIVTNFAQCLDIDDPPTFMRFTQQQLSIQNTLLGCATNFVIDDQARR
jgi:hypothetical protein